MMKQKEKVWAGGSREAQTLPALVEKVGRSKVGLEYGHRQCAVQKRGQVRGSGERVLMFQQ